MRDTLIAGTAAAATVVGAFALRRRRTLRVPCQLDLEATQEHFHAHVALAGVEVEPGDAVLVHDAPSRIPVGTKRVYDAEATVEQAGWLRRQWTRLVGRLSFYELYDVGFEG